MVKFRPPHVGVYQGVDEGVGVYQGVCTQNVPLGVGNLVLLGDSNIQTPT